MSNIFGMSNLSCPVNFKLFRESLDKIKEINDEYNYYFDSSVSLGVVSKNEYDLYMYNNMTIIYNGELYNKDELSLELKKEGYNFSDASDAQIILMGFDCYKEKVLERMNGVFSFVIYYDSKLFIARDRLGIKPLYYAIFKNDIVFSTQIKSIIEYTDYKDVNIDGLKELIGMLPSSSRGKTVYQNIFELPNGSYIKFDGKIKIVEYWRMKARKLDITFDEAKMMVRGILDDSIERQSNGNVSTMLSGGLDSSIVTSKIALNKGVNTYSVDYELNDTEYKIDDYNTSKDNDYIKYILDKYNLYNKTFKIGVDKLLDSLKDSLKCRDYPAMADVDSSFYCFCEKISKTEDIILTGECADELFGGYKWYYEGNLDGFPWIRHISLKENLLNDDIKEKLNINEYVMNEYNEAIKRVDVLSDDSESMVKKRRLMVLNVEYFMQTLLHRADMLKNGLIIRVPFADYRLAELLYNISWEYMYYNNTEKGLLRECYKDILPFEIFNRKKSPYPKIHTKKYKEMISKEVLKILDGDTILTKLFKKEEIVKLIDSDEIIPWFGQLMTIPQLLAFLYQIDYWYKEYKIRIIGL